MDLQHVYLMRQFPGSHCLPRRRMDTMEWSRLVRRCCVTGLILLGITGYFLYQGFQQWNERRIDLNLARASIDQLNEEIARQQLLNSYSTEQAVELAAAMQKVVLSGGGTQQAFLAVMVPEALRIQITRGIPASATLAMSIYESGYGKSELARTSNNLFGMKAFESVWTGDKVYLPTKDSGKKTMAYFRSYPTVSAAVDGYANFLQAPRYSKAFEHRQGKDFVAAVLKAGYCPDRSYLGNIVNIMERHHLAELDAIRPKLQKPGEQVAMMGVLKMDKIGVLSDQP